MIKKKILLTYRKIARINDRHHKKELKNEGYQHI
jgi:hypothetical protein